MTRAGRSASRQYEGLKPVYKFTSAPNGISNLQNRRLKLSAIDDLNDPFDPIDTSDPVISNAVDGLIAHFRRTTAIVCLSRNCENLPLWRHYGASHTSICLGFDIADGEAGANYDTDLLYQPNVLRIDGPQDVNFDLANRLLPTKHESWSYEQEVRMFIRLNDPPDANGLNWIDFGPQLELKEVIIWSPVPSDTEQRSKRSVEPYGVAVKCWWAGMRRNAFLLVKHEPPPYWHAIVK